MAEDLIYYSSNPCLDSEKHELHEILRFWPEDVETLRKQNADISILSFFQKYYERGIHPEMRERILRWMHTYKLINISYINYLMEYMTFNQLKRYTEKQFSYLTKAKNIGNGKHLRIVREQLLSKYIKYIEICKRKNYDISDHFILFPDNLQRSYDQLSTTESI